jgi:hypothetical protein
LSSFFFLQNVLAGEKLPYRTSWRTRRHSNSQQLQEFVVADVERQCTPIFKYQLLLERKDLDEESQKKHFKDILPDLMYQLMGDGGYHDLTRLVGVSSVGERADLRSECAPGGLAQSLCRLLACSCLF